MKPPTSLSDEMQTWWRTLARRYRFGPHHLCILQCACESWDRKAQAATLIATDGLTTTTRGGELRLHPAVGIERDSRLAFIRAVRELALADEDLPEEVRPPRLRGYKGRS